MATFTTTTPLRQLLDAGFPREHIVIEANRHLEALRELPADTADRDQAITETEAFLTEIIGTEH